MLCNTVTLISVYTQYSSSSNYTLSKTRIFVVSGCRVDNVFIPYGGSRVMDDCNNVCACRSREGIVSI